MRVPNGFEQLPLWLRGRQVQRLASALHTFFQRTLNAMQRGGNQWRTSQAQGLALDLLASERSVQRVPGEPEGLYRKRVQGAFATARVAGSKPGLQRTLRLWGLNAVILERGEHDLGLDRIVVGFSGMWAQNTVAHLLELHGRAGRLYQVGEAPLSAPLPLKTLTSGLAISTLSAD